MPDLYTITSQALPDDVRVAGFTAIEGLSQLYRLSVGVLTGSEIDIMEARGQAATLSIAGNDEEGPFVFGGLIAEMVLRHAWAGQALYELIIRPRPWGLTLSHQSRVFVDMSVPDIIEQVFEADAMPPGSWELKLSGDHQPHFHTCQYKESRWAFLSRLMEREGLYYFFEHGEKDEKLIITDHRSYHEPLRKSPARYVPLSGTEDAISSEAIHLLTSRSRSLHDKLRLRDFDYLNPNLDVVADHDVGDESASRMIFHGDHDFRSDTRGNPKAQALAEAFQARELTFEARGRVFGLRSGYRFTVEEHPHESMNTEYLAVQLRHSGVQAAESDLVRELLGIRHGDDYRVELEAIPATTQWRAAATTPVPRISGVERGFIDGPDDSEYAQIDEHGRYKVKLHFDIDDSDQWDGTASTWIRMLQPHGGTVEGFHFPLRKNTEVMIIFLGGHPDRPVIAGAVPNATQTSPVTDNNHEMNMIVTGASNMVSLCDLRDRQFIELWTPPETTYLYLGHPEHGGRSAYIELNTGGNQLVNIGGQRDIEVGGAQNEHVVGDVTETYDANHSITVSGARTENITGDVDETYSAMHRSTVGATRIDIVQGSVVETYNSDQTSVVAGSLTDKAASRTTDVDGGWDATIGGQLSMDAGTYSLKAGYTKLTQSNTLLDWGPTTGKIALFSVSAPGGWTVNAPKDLWQFGQFEKMGAKATEVTGFSSGLTGAKFEGAVLAVGGTGIKIERTGLEDVNEAAELRTAGPALLTAAVRAITSAIFSIG